MKKTSEEYTKLYHYTTEQGLNGILDSQSLWAKNYKYLNDEKEILLFIEDKFITFLYPFIEKVYTKRVWEEEKTRERFFKSGESLKDICKHDARALSDSFLAPLEKDIYICSFSGQSKDKNINEHGLLSQWRAYGHDGGYCLVFDTKKLEELNTKEIQNSSYGYIGLGDLVYSDNDKKYSEEFDDSLKTLAESACALANNIGKKQFKFEHPDIFTPFINCVTRYKHFGFKEENEIRLVAVPFDDPKRKKQKVEIISHNFPYINMFSKLDEKLPIERIIVGPHKDKDKYKRAELLARKLKNTGIEISVSDIPYIGMHNAK